MNNVSIIGRLTMEPELRFYGSGSCKARFSIAVDRNYQKQGQEKQVSFFWCEVWGKSAENLCQYRGQGDQIAVTGELIQERWLEGSETRSRIYINANRIDYLRKKGEGNGQQTQPRPPAPEARPVEGYNNQPHGAPDYESIPFNRFGEELDYGA